MPIPSLIAAAVIGLATGQAVATDTTAAQAPAAPASEAVPSKDDDDRVVCRKVRSIGTNMTTRDCRTVGQRRKDAETARDALRNGGRGIDNLDIGGQ